MIDYIFAFADQTTAQADPQVGAYFINGAWRGDVCIPGLGVSVLGTGQPMTGTDLNGNTTTWTGPNAPLDALWRILISLPAQDSTLASSAGLEVMADRDVAQAGGALSDYVLWSSIPLTNLAALSVSPQFAGSNYVFGAT